MTEKFKRYGEWDYEVNVIPFATQEMKELKRLERAEEERVRMAQLYEKWKRKLIQWGLEQPRPRIGREELFRRLALKDDATPSEPIKRRF